jgi:hypothetical protein
MITIKKTFAIIAIVALLSTAITSCKTSPGAHCAAYTSISVPNTNAN